MANVFVAEEKEGTCALEEKMRSIVAELEKMDLSGLFDNMYAEKLKMATMRSEDCM